MCIRDSFRDDDSLPNVPARPTRVGEPPRLFVRGGQEMCIRDSGKIDTYESDQPLTPSSPFWWQASQMNSPDECVLWNTKLSVGSYPRAAGFDGKLGADGTLGTYVYIGEYNTRSIVRLDAKTGALLKRINVGVCPYGLVLDRAGNVWAQNEWDNDCLLYTSRQPSMIEAWLSRSDSTVSPGWSSAASVPTLAR